MSQSGLFNPLFPPATWSQTCCLVNIPTVAPQLISSFCYWQSGSAGLAGVSPRSRVILRQIWAENLLELYLMTFLFSPQWAVMKKRLVTRTQSGLARKHERGATVEITWRVMWLLYCKLTAEVNRCGRSGFRDLRWISQRVFFRMDFVSHTERATGKHDIYRGSG